MGVNFSVKASCCELMQPVLAKARRKFWADQAVICGPKSLAARIRYFDRLVTGSALWCSSAILPDRQALMMVNAHLYMMVVWMMGLRRRMGEDWLACSDTQGGEGSGAQHLVGEMVDEVAAAGVEICGA